ncbi:DNA-binding response regulator [Rhizocola hellebori]|uniref:DNA-binding response regulator n=1 Tax=Rhizocola hellebori TaxID=1392758 RepID=A0A8J3VI53_9ACTN|nr:response regulator transcription factor [Rhizocola hellebori]GIH06671.1 DNA-binding response regulator [Rhizocola hellebori]
MRVLIVEDQALLRDGLTRMLTAYGMDVATTPADGTGLAERIVAQQPDIAVVDVRLPPTFTDEGLRAAVAARRAVPGLPILVLSQYVERLYARELLADGASAVGYLLKDRVADVRQFIDAVGRVAAGATVMDPDVIARLLHRPDTLATLTTREGDVLRLMAEGHSNAAIAARIAVTEKSVSNLINSLFAKLGLPPSADHHRRVLAVLSYLDHA